MFNSLFGGGAQMVANTVSDDAAAQQMERRRRIATAWRRYNGHFDAPLKPTKNDPQGKDNITLNLARFVVNISAFFLFGKECTFEIDKQQKGDDAQSKRSPDEQWLDDCWKANKKKILLLDAAINGGVTGDVFLRVKEPKLPGGLPRIIVLDSANLDVTWAPDDVEDVRKVVNQWNAPDPVSGKMFTYRQTFMPNAAQWHIEEAHSEPNSAKFSVDAEYEWPYLWCPVFHAKNLPNPNCYYGTADLEEDVLDANDDLNFTLSNTARIIRTHAHPKTWGKGFNAKQIDLSVDSLTIFDSPQAELKNLEMQTDLGSSREFSKDLKAAFHQITNVPEIAAGKLDSIGQLSGLALQLLFGPLIRLTQTKQMPYEDLLETLSGCLLQMRPASRSTEYAISITWPEILPKDAATEAAAALAKQQAGVSKATSLTEMGYDPEEEAQKTADEAKTAQQLGADMLSQFEKGQLDGQGGNGTSGTLRVGGGNGVRGQNEGNTGTDGSAK